MKYLILFEDFKIDTNKYGEAYSKEARETDAETKIRTYQGSVQDLINLIQSKIKKTK